ncbi:hypothetical protein ABL78_8455 [Leptomonas seymouri]|uniref:Uncharacterized protein n=1 Tax=Leptomonas seymouri TaxID=5684 RepID=A0A0N1P8Y1_LEPSE|nr:hypothetical protein ABL78_8455 [Leptomonas seymouri]|eukprot:KPI82535.1 hypothetical protein ABL78_8455 [Leptomonas seymouri]
MRRSAGSRRRDAKPSFLLLKALTSRSTLLYIRHFRTLLTLRLHKHCFCFLGLSVSVWTRRGGGANPLLSASEPPLHIPIVERLFLVLISLFFPLHTKPQANGTLSTLCQPCFPSLPLHPAPPSPPPSPSVGN